MIDIKLNENEDLTNANGDFVMGESLDQDVAIIIKLNQGDFKSDPILGAGLFRLINSNATAAEIKAKIKLHLERDGKNYEEIKEAININ